MRENIFIFNFKTCDWLLTGNKHWHRLKCCCLSVYNTSRFTHVLLYASFNHDALSDRFIFTICSKYTWALVHSYLIGWGLIWFPAPREWKQSGDVVTVFCYTPAAVDCHSDCVTVTFLSCLSWCQTAVGGHRSDLIGSDPERLISYWGWESVPCVHVSCVLMCLCCVWVQVIIWRATVCTLCSSGGAELSLWWLIHLSRWSVSPC